MRLQTATGPVRGEATPPPSKSLTHRAAVAAALCPGGTTRLVRPLEADDTKLTRAALECLGAEIVDAGSDWVVTGIPADGVLHRDGPPLTLDLGNSGTSLRLLLPVAALGRRRVHLDGVPRLRQRPVGPQADVLAALGATIRWGAREGMPPLEIRGPLCGGSTRLDASESSQFLSGLLLAAAGMEAPLEVRATALSSRPYVALTTGVLHRFGIAVRAENDLYVVPAGRPSSPGSFAVEPDASAAAFLLAAAAVTGGRVRVRGVGSDSVQGDRMFAALLARMGCRVEQGADWTEVEGRPRTGIDADLNDVPDLVPPLVAVALFAPGPSRLTGISHLRLKESDRIAALATESARLGARAEAGEDSLTFTPAPLSGAAVSAHGDHRIAMAMAIAALGVEGVDLDDPACVSKSYPDFFADLARLLSG